MGDNQETAKMVHMSVFQEVENERAMFWAALEDIRFVAKDYPEIPVVVQILGIAKEALSKKVTK